MNEIYLYRLKSGESVIGEFLRSETINERTGEVAHIVRHPFVVPTGRYDQMQEYFPGCLDSDYPISMNDMSLIVTGDESVDSVLVEIYQRLVYGCDEMDETIEKVVETAETPLTHHQV